MVSNSPKDRVVPLPNGLFMAYKWGDPITTYKSLEPILQVVNPLEKKQKNPKFANTLSRPEENLKGQVDQWR